MFSKTNNPSYNAKNGSAKVPTTAPTTAKAKANVKAVTAVMAKGKPIIAKGKKKKKKTVKKGNPNLNNIMTALAAK